MTLYDLKPRFQALLRPLVRALAAARVTANQVTVGTMLASLAIGAYVTFDVGATWPLLLLPVWYLVRMAANAIDGLLAREHGQRSPLGAYLNELSDVVSDAALYLPFAAVAPFGPYSVGLVIVAACISEMAGVLGPTVGASRRYDGPMGKSDRALTFGVLALYLGLGGTLPEGAVWLMPAIAALIACNVVNRTRRGVAAATRPSA